MELASIASVGSLATAALGVIGFFLAQGANLRKLIEAGDRAVRDAESKARHTLANTSQRINDDLRRDVEQLKRECFRREEAREMEARITQVILRVESKVDRQGEQISHLMALDGNIKIYGEQVRDFTTKIIGNKFT